MWKTSLRVNRVLHYERRRMSLGMPQSCERLAVQGPPLRPATELRQYCGHERSHLYPRLSTHLRQRRTHDGGHGLPGLGELYHHIHLFRQLAITHIGVWDYRPQHNITTLWTRQTQSLPLPLRIELVAPAISPIRGGGPCSFGRRTRLTRGHAAGQEDSTTTDTGRLIVAFAKQCGHAQCTGVCVHNVRGLYNT